MLGRAVQGIGAGGITPAASAVVADTFPPAQRGRALGLIGATFGMAFLVGPLLATAVLTITSWPWLFLINLPIALFVIVLGWTRLPQSRSAATAPLDFLGTLLGGALLVCLMLGINQALDRLLGALLWPWLLGAASIGLLLFIAVERRAIAPLVPLRLFADRTLAVTYLVGIGAGFGMGNVIFVAALGALAFAIPAERAGVLLIPLVLTSSVAAPLAGQWLSRIGARGVLLAGFGSLALASAGLALASASVWIAGPASCLLGAGVGAVVNGALRVVVLERTDATDRATAQGMITLGTSIGNLLVVATLGSIARSIGGIAGYAAAYGVAAIVAAVMGVLALRLPAHQRVATSA